MDSIQKCVSTALLVLSLLSSIMFCQAALVRTSSPEQAEYWRLHQRWLQHVSWERVRAAPGAGCLCTSDLGRLEMKPEMSVGGHIALGGGFSFDLLPCLAQDYKAASFSKYHESMEVTI